MTITVFGLNTAQPMPLSMGLVGLAQRNADLVRLLSDPLGVDQAWMRRAKLEGTTFDTIVCSPAERAIRTAEICADVDRGRDYFYVLRELYPPMDMDGVKFDQLYAELRHRPPSAYLAHELNCTTNEIPCGPVGRMAFAAGRAIQQCLHCKTPTGAQADETVLISGEGVLVPLAALELINAVVGANEHIRASLLSVCLPEAGAFRLTFDEHCYTNTTFEMLL